MEDFDRFGKIVNDRTFQTTNRSNFSPGKAVSPWPRKKMLMEINNPDRFGSPRFPKAKPFFEQAYAPKSIVERESNKSTLSKSKHSSKPIFSTP